jgi:hypothetical protein
MVNMIHLEFPARKSVVEGKLDGRRFPLHRPLVPGEMAEKTTMFYDKQWVWRIVAQTL